MDEQVKARLIGATVLVVIAVGLVPELLSGPRRAPGVDATGSGKPGTRTVTIDLGGAVAAGSRVQQVPTPTASAPREPAPRPPVQVPGAAAEQGDAIETTAEASGPPDVAPSEPRPAATVASTTPVAPPPAIAAASTNQTAKPEPFAARPTTKGGWAVQVGAFGSADTARRLVSELKKDGLAAYVAPLERNGKTLHRVRVGPTPNRPEAEKLAARLKAKGMAGSVVPAG
jgi:DedD protein